MTESAKNQPLAFEIWVPGQPKVYIIQVRNVTLTSLKYYVPLYPPFLESLTKNKRLV